MREKHQNTPEVQKAIEDVISEFEAMSQEEFNRAIENHLYYQDIAFMEISSPEFLRQT